MTSKEVSHDPTDWLAYLECQKEFEPDASIAKAWRKDKAEIEQLKARINMAQASALVANEEAGRLRAALEKSADTFADFNRGLRLLNRPLLADACEIAEKAAREALAGSASSAGLPQEPSDSPRSRNEHGESGYPPNASPTPVPSTWLCGDPECRAENHDQYLKCYACEHPRPSSSAGDSDGTA